MLLAALKFTHLLGIVIWIGGMIFAHFFLRPALATLDGPTRLQLMHAVLGHFFSAVLVIVGLVIASGLGLIAHTARLVASTDGLFQMPLSWTLMASFGLVMTGIFLYIRFALYRRLSRAVGATEWPAGATALAEIRYWVTVNMMIGVAILLLTVAGF